MKLADLVLDALHKRWRNCALGKLTALIGAITDLGKVFAQGEADVRNAEFGDFAHKFSTQGRGLQIDQGTRRPCPCRLQGCHHVGYESVG